MTNLRFVLSAMAMPMVCVISEPTECIGAESWHLSEPGLCPKGYSRPDCARKLETDFLAGFNGASRSDSVLALYLDTGTKVTLRDFGLYGEREGSTRYSLLAYLPERHLFVLHVAISERERFSLIDSRSGEHFEIEGEFLLSPEGDRLAAVVSDFGGDSELEVWALPEKNRKAHLELKVVTDEERFLSIEWRGSSALLLSKASSEFPLDEDSQIQSNLSCIVYKESEWQLVEADACSR